jgi:hypothetical protein
MSLETAPCLNNTPTPPTVGSTDALRSTPEQFHASLKPTPRAQSLWETQHPHPLPNPPNPLCVIIFDSPPRPGGEIGRRRGLKKLKPLVCDELYLF